MELNETSERIDLAVILFNDSIEWNEWNEWTNLMNWMIVLNLIIGIEWTSWLEWIEWNEWIDLFVNVIASVIERIEW